MLTLALHFLVLWERVRVWIRGLTFPSHGDQQAAAHVILTALRLRRAHNQRICIAVK